MNFSTSFLSYELEYPFRTIQDTEGIDHPVQFLDVPTYNKGVKQATPLTLATMKKYYS